MSHGDNYTRRVETLTADVKRQALALGFDLVGVAAAGAATGAVRLDRWLRAGMHGGMDYMARTAGTRSDPRHLLAGCRSLLVVAMSYRSEPEPAPVGEGDRVGVSRYAWGRDYHDLLKRRLIRLGRWLEQRAPGSVFRAAVDTEPVLEREWAAAAGLGWIGKSTSLVNRRLGSELFLGVLLNDVELVPDRPVRSHCGRCTACLDACPTGALVEPGLLDARRCLSYLTLEHRGEIPAKLRPAMGRTVAGCDICQQVCPWNRRAPADLHEELAAVPGRVSPLLADLERLDEAGYRAWRAGSALRRLPFAELKRNLEVVRANLKR